MDASQPTFSQAIKSFPARLTLYAVTLFLLFQVVLFGLQEYGPWYMGSENGPIELTQVCLAVVAAMCLFYAASICRRGRAGIITCAAMVAYAAARESDAVFEMLFFEDSYKWLVGLPMLLVALTALWIDRQRIVREAMWLVKQPSVTLFAVAGIYLCVVCQVLDRPSFWAGISSPSEAESTKAMVEEFAELFAYALLALAGIESVIAARNGELESAAEFAEAAASGHQDQPISIPMRSATASEESIRKTA